MRILESFFGQFRAWTKFEKGLAAMAVLGSIVLTILWSDSLFGLSITLTGVLCVILVAKRSNWNYLWGTYNVIGYAYLAYTWGLGGDFMLNAFYFLPMQFVGLAMWSRNLEKGAIVKSRDFTQKGYIQLGFITVGIVAFYSLVLRYIVAPFFNGLEFALEFPIYDSYFLYLFDSMSTVLSVIAMWLMAKRYAAQWLLWIIVNVASIGMWVIALASNDAYPVDALAMILMWSMYLINAVYGYIVWFKTARVRKDIL